MVQASALTTDIKQIWEKDIWRSIDTYDGDSIDIYNGGLFSGPISALSSLPLSAATAGFELLN
jgi:hypothetical protein